MVALTLLVHWLHVLGGLAWFGSYVFVAFVFWPLLFRRPAAEARALFTDVAPSISRLMAISGQLVIWLGLLRGTWLGPVRSFHALTSTSYGHTFGAAIVLTIVLAVYGARSGAQYETRLWDGENFQPGARAFVRRSNAVSLGLLALILACMVAMRFGL